LKNWENYFEKPIPLKLYVMHTGYIHMSGDIHFNKKDPRKKSMPKDRRFNPVYAFLVEHPDKGLLLLDTGLHPSFAERKTGNFGLLLGTLVKTRTDKGKDIASQLSALNFSLDQVSNVILSHLHLDHPCSLPLFRGHGDPRVFADPAELSMAGKPLSLFKGYIRSHLKGMDCRPLTYNSAIEPFDKVTDFFEDGSVFVIRTPGHSPGHVSVLLNALKGPILMTFDAAHREDNLKQELPPIGDYELALDTLWRLQQVINRFPVMRVIYSHDPDQLPTLKLLPDYYM
jgi:N-acyl homoserine lactone hydrolase